MVERQGYQTQEASDGVEALQKLSVYRFDYVISDIQMPNMDGVELLAKIRALYPDITVIIVTGQPDAAMADRALEESAEDM